MRNLILPIIITLWGTGIVLRGLLGDGIAAGGSYGAGQTAAFVLGLVMVGAGARALVKHFSARA